ncbi:MAG: hypothetical protein BroJett011_04300 [Chloroflexota bacterium]|nr:MAG: hypothetical protein BroJett011_04300 [Chloroflexota bacterium]
MTDFHCIYFDADDRADFIAWVETRPEGRWHVLIGSDDTPTNIVIRVTAWVASARGPEVVRWFADQLQADRIVVRASKKLDIPSGLPLS